MSKVKLLIVLLAVALAALAVPQVLATDLFTMPVKKIGAINGSNYTVDFSWDWGGTCFVGLPRTIPTTISPGEETEANCYEKRDGAPMGRIRDIPRKSYNVTISQARLGRGEYQTLRVSRVSTGNWDGEGIPLITRKCKDQYGYPREVYLLGVIFQWPGYPRIAFFGFTGDIKTICYS